MSNDRIKVLFLAADPFRDGAELELDEELRAIRRALRQGKARDTLEFEAYFATRTRDVQLALLEYQPQIVHFSGHGDAPGLVYLGGEHGCPQPVDREALRGLFGILDDTVRVVVLNGCDTLATVQALSEVADYTVGMDSAIGDGAPIVFAEAFYRALAMGCNVLTAFELGVSRLEREGNPEAATPVRRIRPGVNLDDSLVPGRGAAAASSRPSAVSSA